MPLVHDPAPANGPLRQGEILRDVWEHRALVPASKRQTDDPVEFVSIQHPLMVVMSADCDLEQDYKARHPEFAAPEHRDKFRSAPEKYQISYVILCEAFEETSIRSLLPLGREFWNRVRGNQDERYHRFPSATIRGQELVLPDLYLDFKRYSPISTEQLYAGLATEGLERVAIVPPIYLHDLLHRFYGFLSRVGTPD